MSLCVDLYHPVRRGGIESPKMTSHNWTIDETNLMIRKRLELLGCARSDKVYDQISNYLSEEHNYYVSRWVGEMRLIPAFYRDFSFF